MIKNNHAIALFKIGKAKWMNKLIEGNINFSCCGYFINEANVDKNEIQGDALEAVFAKLRRSDSRIENIREKYGKDLEEINAGGYVYFRRKSALRRPIFCLYGYKAEDLISDNVVKHSGIQQLSQNIDKRMFEGFSNNFSMNNVLSNDERFQALLIDPKGFTSRLKEGIKFIDRIDETKHSVGIFKPSKSARMCFELKPINYDYFKKETFILDVSDEYEELFYKLPEYSYQREVRICIKNREFTDIYKRYNLKVRKFDIGKDVFVLKQPFQMQYVASIAKRK